MKHSLLVLLEPDVDDLDAALRRALEPRRLNDDSPESIQAYHWDYWFLPEEDQPPLSSIVARRFPSCSPDLVRYAAYVADLPDGYGYHATAILTPDGQWHDLEDFGWKLLAEPSPSNARALTAWASHATELLRTHTDHIGVLVWVHR